MTLSNECNSVISEAVKHYGDESRKLIAIEECAELINALAKESRGRSTADDIIEEIADVIIACEQLAIIYGTGAVNQEIVRKCKRLKDYMYQNKM